MVEQEVVSNAVIIEAISKFKEEARKHYLWL